MRIKTLSLALRIEFLRYDTNCTQPDRRGRNNFCTFFPLLSQLFILRHVELRVKMTQIGIFMQI